MAICPASRPASASAARGAAGTDAPLEATSGCYDLRRRRRRLRRAARVGLKLAAAGVLLLLLAYAGFEAAVRFAPYPSGLDRPPPTATLFLDRSGTPLAAFAAAADGRWHLPLAAGAFGPHLPAAVVAVEDARFASHAGVDWSAAAAAAVQNVWARGVRRGGSTLTMQLHRLREPRPRGWLAKAEQAVRARQIERASTKDQILAEYLNRAPFGGGLVGAGAASYRYFGKPCDALSLGEAALLAGLPQNPNRLRPDRFPQAALARRHHVLARMAATGAITPQQRADADAEPLTAAWRPLPQDRPTTAGGAGSTAAVADGLLPTLLGLRAAGTGGRGSDGTIRTTVDAAVQRTAGALAADRLADLGPSGVTAVAVVVLDTASADLLAAASLELRASPDAAKVHPGRAASGSLSPEYGTEGTGSGLACPVVATSALDLTRRPRSTGSALKPFVYAAAFDAGIATPATVLRDEPAAWAGYAPANYDRSFGGPMTAADALARSRNVPALLLLEQVGVDRAVGVLAGVGIATPGAARRPPGLSLAVGGADATPLEVAQGYAALARGGTPRTARLVAVAVPSATLSPAADTVRPAPCLRPAACVATLRALADRDRTAAVCPEAAAGTHVAWKTGTSGGHRDAWCAAVTPAVTVVVWLGNADGRASAALVGQDAAAPLALRLVAALDREGMDWPTTDRELAGPALAQRAAGGLGPRVGTGPTAGEGLTVGVGPTVGPTPRLAIVSPAPGTTVVLDPDRPPADQRVPLRAAWRSTGVVRAGADGGGAGDPTGSRSGSPSDAPLYWFVDGALVGRGSPGEPTWWTPTPGRHDVRVTDAAGRAATADLTVGRPID